MTAVVAPSTSVRKPKPNKISYVVPFPSNETGHRLGINALVLDTDASTFDHSDAGILYSGGRDGAIKAWDLHLSLDEVEESAANDYIHQSPNNMENRRWKVNSSSKVKRRPPICFLIHCLLAAPCLYIQMSDSSAHALDQCPVSSSQRSLR